MYVRTCDKTWKEIVSVYSSEVDFPVRSEEVWDQEFLG
jgi:hypothetical protein